MILSGVLHFVDAGTARDAAAAFARAIAPGSYLIISVGSGNPSEGENFTSAYTAARVRIHSRASQPSRGSFMAIRHVVTIQVAPGRTAEFADAFRVLQAIAQREDGCEQYELFQQRILATHRAARRTR